MTTQKQIDLLHHTIGVRPDRREPFRNHFMAGPGHHDQPDLEVLEAAGLMVRRASPSFCDSSDVLFRATDTGRALALDLLPQPRSQRWASGLVHVSVFLTQAFEQLSPILLPRSDLHKCVGGGLASCDACARKLAPSGAGQQWTSPQVEHGVCSVLADVDRYLGLYISGPHLKNADMPGAE